LQFLKHIKVKKTETRPEDFWYDMSMRQLRNGVVKFFSVKDFLTGEWLFKLTKDSETGKLTLTAAKCPSGVQFSQLEGKSMVFQDSQIEGMLYDVISLTEMHENNRLKRNVVATLDEVPDVIKDNYEIKSYEQATGKKAPGKYLVTLHKKDDETGIVTLFVLERAWSLSDLSPAEKFEEKEAQMQQKVKTPKKEIDTEQDWICPICGKAHRLFHVESGASVRHVLRKKK
jgi:hypothetical protein